MDFGSQFSQRNSLSSQDEERKKRRVAILLILPVAVVTAPLTWVALNRDEDAKGVPEALAPQPQQMVDSAAADPLPGISAEELFGRAPADEENGEAYVGANSVSAELGPSADDGAGVTKVGAAESDLTTVSGRPWMEQQRRGVHIVQAGDTLYSIGRQSGVRPEEIAAANGLSPNDPILAGQQLQIPAFGGSSNSTNGTGASAPSAIGPLTQTAGIDPRLLPIPVSSTNGSGSPATAIGETAATVPQTGAYTGAGVPLSGGAPTVSIPATPIAGTGNAIQVPGGGVIQTPGTPTIPGNPVRDQPNIADPQPLTNPLVGATCVGYAVRQGDTIESIATSLFADPNTIRAANGITGVAPGQTILVPIQTAILPCR